MFSYSLKGLMVPLSSLRTQTHSLFSLKWHYDHTHTSSVFGTCLTHLLSFGLSHCMTVFIMLQVFELVQHLATVLKLLKGSMLICMFTYMYIVMWTTSQWIRHNKGMAPGSVVQFQNNPLQNTNYSGGLFCESCDWHVKEHVHKSHLFAIQ